VTVITDKKYSIIDNKGRIMPGECKSGIISGEHPGKEEKLWKV
jgi:hypothetical protein